MQVSNQSSATHRLHPPHRWPKQFDSAAANLPALLAEFDQTFPALSTQIKDEDGKLRKFINIYINDEDIRFLGGETYAFQDGDEVMLIPSIAGGA